MMTNLITKMHCRYTRWQYNKCPRSWSRAGRGVSEISEHLHTQTRSPQHSLWPRILRVSASGPRTPGPGLRRPMGGWSGLRGMSVVRARFEKVLLNFFSASSNFSYS